MYDKTRCTRSFHKEQIARVDSERAGNYVLRGQIKIKLNRSRARNTTRNTDTTFLSSVAARIALTRAMPPA